MSKQESGTATDDRRVQGERGGASRLARYARRALRSGALAGVGGGVSLLAGVRALRRGDRVRGVVRLALGGLLVAVAVRQRRGGEQAGAGSGVDQTDVVDTSPDIEDAGPAPELDSDVDATDVDQTDVVDTGIDEADLADAAGGTEADEASAGEEE
jgi:hypothetical protein